MPGSKRETGRSRIPKLLTLIALVATAGTGVAAVSKDTATAQTAALPTSWATVVNVGSGKCVDARAAGTTNGTVVQQYACNGSQAQQWQFAATSGGYAQVDNGTDATKAWDVTDVSTTDSALVQLWTYGGGNNQQWQAVAESSGAYHFVNRNSGKCLDVPSASTADSVQLQQYACNGSAASPSTSTPWMPNSRPGHRTSARMSPFSTRPHPLPPSRAA